MKKLIILVILTIIISYVLAFPEPTKRSKKPGKSRKNPLHILRAHIGKKGNKMRPRGQGHHGPRGAKQLNFDDVEKLRLSKKKVPSKVDDVPHYEQDLDAVESIPRGRWKRHLFGRLFGNPSGHYRRHWWPANHRRHHGHHNRHHHRHHHRWGHAY